jgi:hypothetical protein
LYPKDNNGNKDKDDNGDSSGTVLLVLSIVFSILSLFGGAIGGMIIIRKKRLA